MTLRYTLIAPMILSAMLITSAVPAAAAFRSPQILFGSTALQQHLNDLGESVNVQTEQQEGLVWGSTVSGNSAMTIQFELNGNPSGAELGIAALNPGGHSVFALIPVFPATADSGWFAVASFRPGNNLIVTLFDENATLISQHSYIDVDRSLFAYYITHAHGTFFSHEGFNSDGKVHSLTYAAKGMNSGSWWMAWEDTPIAEYSTKNFFDALLFLESVNPTPAARTSWGELKNRFR